MGGDLPASLVKGGRVGGEGALRVAHGSATHVRRGAAVRQRHGWCVCNSVTEVWATFGQLGMRLAYVSDTEQISVCGGGADASVNTHVYGSTIK
jgi:hypothetical protein